MVVAEVAVPGVSHVCHPPTHIPNSQHTTPAIIPVPMRTRNSPDSHIRVRRVTDSMDRLVMVILVSLDIPDKLDMDSMLVVWDRRDVSIN